MRQTAMLAAVAAIIVGCYTGPTYTKPGKDNDKQAMEQAIARCDAQARPTCSPGGDGYNYCVKARTKQCMEGEGWTEK